MSKHVTTYDELRDGVKEAKEELLELVEGDVPDFKDTEKIISKLERLLAEAKPRKERNK